MLNIGYIVKARNESGTAVPMKDDMTDDMKVNVRDNDTAPRERCITQQSARLIFGRNWRLQTRIKQVRVVRSF